MYFSLIWLGISSPHLCTHVTNICWRVWHLIMKKKLMIIRRRQEKKQLLNIITVLFQIFVRIKCTVTERVFKPKDTVNASLFLINHWIPIVILVCCKIDTTWVHLMCQITPHRVFVTAIDIRKWHCSDKIIYCTRYYVIRTRYYLFRTR